MTVQSALIFLSAVAACLCSGGRAEAQAIRAGFHVASWGLNAPSAEWSGSLPPLASALARVTSPGDPRAETNLPTPFENGAPAAAAIFGAAEDDAVAPLESGERRLPEKPVTPDSTGSRPATPQPSLAPETRQRLAEAATDRALAPWQREIMLGMAIDGHAGAAGDELPRPPSRATSGEFSTNSDGTWIQEPPVIPERSGHTAIYDPVRDRMVVFGGTKDDCCLSNDVWALSLSGTPAWTQLNPTGTPPGKRRGHSAIYDPVRDRMVVFGGYNFSRDLSEVWALSLAGSPAWTQLTPAGTSPSARLDHTAIYDAVRDRMLVFGGYSGISYFFYNDVWALSLSSVPAWTQLTPAGTPPSAWKGDAGIYDPVRDRLLVFGRFNLNDVWALSLAVIPTWTQLTPAGTPPSGRSGHTATYDPVRDRMIIFGGYDSSYFNDVWALSLAGSPSWTQLSPAGTSPSTREGHTSIYDPVRDRMVAFGGFAHIGGLFPTFNDVWALSLASSPAWTELTPATTPPRARSGQTTIYDSVRDRMVVFGGAISGNPVNEVWALSLAGSPTWTQLAPAGTLPSARLYHTAIYDPVRDRMVVFGGNAIGDLNDVWALSLAGSPSWTQLAPAGTPPGVRYAHRAIYDPVRDRMVVFGGGNGVTLFYDVWALSLAGSPAWLQLTPAGGSPGRWYHSAIYDPVRDRMVVFGGKAIGDLNDVWALSLARSPVWTLLIPALTPPTPRSGHTAIYDPVRDRMVVFGGYSGNILNDVWALPLAAGSGWTQLEPAGSANARQGHISIYDPLHDRMVVFGGIDGRGYPINDGWELTWTSTVGVPPRAGGDALWLAPAYPNPSRSAITFGFALARASAATLRIHDVSGRVVSTLVDGSLPAGSQSVRWDRRLSSGGLAQPGLYFFELRVDGHKLARRIVLIR